MTKRDEDVLVRVDLPGVIAGPGLPEKLTAYLLEHLPAALRERFPAASVVIRTDSSPVPARTSTSQSSPAG